MFDNIQVEQASTEPLYYLEIATLTATPPQYGFFCFKFVSDISTTNII